VESRSPSPSNERCSGRFLCKGISTGPVSWPRRPSSRKHPEWYIPRSSLFPDIDHKTFFPKNSIIDLCDCLLLKYWAITVKCVTVVTGAFIIVFNDEEYYLRVEPRNEKNETLIPQMDPFQKEAKN
jgi:hypothetical protein